METRNKYSKVDCEMGLTVEGRELPNASVLGKAMEEAVELIQQRVKESYEVVPPRPDILPTDGQVAQPAQPALPAQPTNPVPFGR